MNRYLVRSLVAILTFSIGVAVGSIFRPSVQPSYRQFRHKRCRDSVPPQAYLSAERYPSPSIAIDNAATDPINLRYSFTRPSAPGSSRQTVEFTVDATSSREVSKFTINYRSRWSAPNKSGGGAVSITNNTRSLSSGLMTFDNVAIECDSDETLSVWVSSVEFQDGSRWENPRHRSN